MMYDLRPSVRGAPVAFLLSHQVSILTSAILLALNSSLPSLAPAPELDLSCNRLWALLHCKHNLQNIYIRINLAPKRMSDADRSELPKLADNSTNNNYGEWQIKSYHKLHSLGLWKYIEGPNSVPPHILAHSD